MGEIKTCFSPKCDPHTAKLCFSVALKHFGGNSQRLLFIVKKVAITERNIETNRKFVFLNIFEKLQILRKIWICLNKCF